MKCAYMVTHSADGILACNLDDDGLVAWLNENGYAWLFEDGPFERAELWVFNDMLAGSGIVIWANH